MSIKVIKGDITELNVDAIVNAANSKLLRGGGVCGAIFRKAGPELDIACAKLGRCDTGKAVITKGFGLPSEYVIHAVGPIHDGSPDNDKELASAYKSSLDLALSYGCNSIAFPCISCGIYGYPVREACSIALQACRYWLESHQNSMEIVLCCFDDETFSTYKELIGGYNG